MPRESRISATRPVFPRYLLSSFTFSLNRRHSAATSSAADAATSNPHAVKPALSNPSSSSWSTPRRWRLSRAAPDTLRCINCSTDLALASQIVSKGFTGRYGRAFLVAPPPIQDAPDQSLINIRVGRSEDRQLVTGWHVVADICCATCSRKLGWKYVDAKENSQKYKVGKYILEVERVITHRSWEDVAVRDLGLIDEDLSGLDRPYADIVFDSDDEEECEDLFAGVWDPATVAKRRSQNVAKQTPESTD